MTERKVAGDSGSSYLEIEHPDFGQVANREILEEQLRKRVGRYLFENTKLKMEPEPYKERSSEVALLTGASFVNFCRLSGLPAQDL